MDFGGNTPLAKPDWSRQTGAAPLKCLSEQLPENSVEQCCASAGQVQNRRRQLALWKLGRPDAQSRNDTGECFVFLAANIDHVNIFPVEARVTGMSISYSVGVSVFGGFAPAISIFLIKITGTPLLRVTT
ncbi:hypothetical protein [Glaciimonas sp. PAMC28666]|uniref:hypothetical protein n=1 Tax=Glaciimonas sp. PAMC28666 TaxID=2807626 RepID=UPI0019636894|nr:hypothetical protein [Glaciimonas sp. PAMC28666]QRX83554.1 hypothetical protein JQN73_04750 [Glaciimonas sp. PAMC28666]